MCVIDVNAKFRPFAEIVKWRTGWKLIKQSFLPIALFEGFGAKGTEREGKVWLHSSHDAYGFWKSCLFQEIGRFLVLKGKLP